MVDREEASQVRYPTNRAFVVQFETGPLDGNRLCGRAEHLNSGRVVHFESLTQLADFVVQVVDKGHNQ